jgi:hypothetical protein
VSGRRLFAIVGAAVVAGGLVAGGFWAGSRSREDSDRQQEVAARGAEVMRFDLERTTHVFEKRAGGGVQTVVADDPADGAQVAKVRAHLREEAEAFAAGDFEDPAAVHGGEMPGLDELQAGAQRLTVDYEDVRAGGRIRYASDDPELVRALHAWFDAQVSDHGRHAAEID